MSDEALSAHLDWLEHCAKAQGMDYETWLEKRVTQLEVELVVARESDRTARVFNVEYSGRAQKAEAENAALKRGVVEYAAMKQYLRSGPNGSTKPMWHDVDEEEKERYRESVRDAPLTAEEQDAHSS